MTDQRKCRVCEEVKPLTSEFFGEYSNKDKKAFRRLCNPCRNAGNRKTYHDNWEAQREAINQRRRDNPDIYFKHQEGRHRRVTARSVGWDKELTDFTYQESHDLRKTREEETGIPFHVDHILPLKGTEVSGFHVWNNLRVIPARTNLQKGNRI